MPPKNALPFDLLGSVMAAGATSININITHTNVSQSVEIGGSPSAAGTSRGKQTTNKGAKAAAALPSGSASKGVASGGVGRAPRAKQTPRKNAGASTDPYPRNMFTADTSKAARPARPKVPKAEPKTEPSTAEMAFPTLSPAQTPSPKKSNKPAQSRAGKAKTTTTKGQNSKPSGSSRAKSSAKNDTKTKTTTTKSSQKISIAESHTTTTTSSRGGRTPAASRVKTK